MQGNQFLIEDHPTVSDFLLWNILDLHEHWQPNSLAKYPRIVQFYTDFRNLDPLQKFFDSELGTLPILRTGMSFPE